MGTMVIYHCKNLKCSYMRNLHASVFCAALCISGFGAFSQVDFGPAEKIIDSIRTTGFPADTIRVTELGAVGDGTTDSRTAIIRAIDACHQKGGGVVLLEGGTFFSKGPLTLKNNVNLHIAAETKLLFSPYPEDYLPAVFTRWEGVEAFNYSPMIYTYGQENIAITGKGMIDGSASEIWVPFRQKQGPAQNRMRDFSDWQAPLHERVFGEGDFIRPSMIQFVYCSRILVEGVTLTNSPLWMLHPVYSSDIIIRGVTFNSMVINNDGIDIDSSEKALIEQCHFRTGDDAIVFKSGRDRDGWRVNRPARDIVVRNCTSPETLHGIAFGSEMSGGIENVYIENFKLGKVKSEAIQFKANQDRGGYIRNVHIRNVEVEEAGNHLFFFTNGYHSYRGGNAPSSFHDIHMENVSCTFAKYTLQLQGLSDAPLYNISFSRVKVDKAGSIFNRMEYFRDILLEHYSVDGKSVKLPEP